MERPDVLDLSCPTMTAADPDVVLRTDRLYLRPLRAEDAAVLYAMNADPLVLRYTGDDPFASPEEARSFIATYPDYRRHGFGRWAVVRTLDDVVIGWCGLKQDADGDVDLGYRFLRSEWGRGYATEAARACVQWGFGEAGLRCIIGRVARANTASIRVLQKIGMRYWKAAPCGPIEDALVFRIERD